MTDALTFREIFTGPGPIPVAIRVNDAVYAWRLSGRGNVSQPPADPVVQMGNALEAMQEMLAASGLSIENVGRATGYIRDAADRDRVYEHWDALYPDPQDRPAFKVLIVDLPEGEEAALDVLALDGARRQRFDIPGVPARDPTVRIGPWVFSSRVHGTDRATSTVPADAQKQVALAYENLGSLMELAGGSVNDISQITAFVRELEHAPMVEESLRAVTAPITQSVTLRTTHSFVRPSMSAMLELTAALPSGQPVVELPNPIVRTAPAPAGIQIGSLIYLPAIRGLSEDTGQLESGYETQIRGALRNARTVLEQAGAGLENVGHVTVYLRDLEGHPVLNTVWPEFFPDPADRPPHKYIPADLPEGVLAQVAVTAVRGERRTVLEIPGMKHGDPMCMGARIGNLVFSSRIVGTDTRTGAMPESSEEQARLAFENVSTLLANAAVTPSDLTRVTAYLRDERDRETVTAAYERFAASAAAPPLHLLVITLPGTTAVRLEITAAA